MANEYGISVYVDPQGAIHGAREFKRSTADISASAKKIENDVQRTSKSITQMGTAASQVKRLLAGFAAGFTIAQATRQIADFEAAMSKIKSLMGTGQGIDQQIAAVEKEARRLGATTVYSAGEAAGAMTELIKAGLTAAQAVKAAGGAMQLAAADGIGLAEAASITATALAQFRLGADQAGRVGDVLAKISVSAQTDVRALGEGMSYAANIAQGLGLTVEQTASALGVLSNAGLQGSMAGTALRTALSALLTPTKQAEGALAKVGLTFADVQAKLGEENGLVKVVDLLKERFAGIENPVQRSALLFTIFGDKGAGAAGALMNLSDQLRDYTVQAENAAGTTENMSKVMTDNLKGDLAEIESAFEELAIQMGESGVRGSMRAMAQDVGALLRGMAGLPEEAGKSTDAMMKWNTVGTTLRNNLELLKDLVIILAGAFIGRYVAALAATGVATVRQIALNTTFAASWRTVAIGAGSATTAMTLATAAGAGLRAVFMLLGGPVGVIMLAATALIAFSNNAEASRASANDLRISLDGLAEGFDKATEAERRNAMQKTALAGIEARNEAERIRKELVTNAKRAETNANFNGLGVMPVFDTLSTYEMNEKLAEQQRLLSAQQQAEKQLRDMAELDSKRRRGITTLDTHTVLAPGEPVVPPTPIDLAEETKKRKGLTEAEKEAKRVAQEFKSALSQLAGEYAPLAAENQKYNESMAVLQKALTLGEDELKKYGLTTADVELAIKNLGTAHQEALLQLDPMAKIIKSLSEQQKAQKQELEPLIALQDEHNESIKHYNEVLALTDEQLKAHGTTREQVLAGLDLENRAFQKNSKEIEENTNKLKGNESMAVAWRKAWESAVERIDGLFVDLWESLLGGGGKFVDQLKDTFKRLFAELAHASITRPLTNWLSTLFAPATNDGFGASAGGGGGGWMRSLMGLFGGSNTTNGGGFLSTLAGLFGGGGNNGGGGGGFFSNIAKGWSSGGLSGAWQGAFGGASNAGSSWASMGASSAFGAAAGNGMWGAFAPSGYTNGTGAFGSAMSAMGGGGAGGNGNTGWATQIGGLIAKGFVKYGTTIGSALGAASPYIAGAAAITGAYYGYNKTEGTGAQLASGISYGALGYTAATVGIGAMAGAAGGAAVGAAGAGAATGAMGAAAAVPIVGWILAALAVIDLATGGKLFGTKFAPDGAATTLGISASGGDATQTITEVRNQALFKGRKWRTKEVAASSEAEKAADDLYQSIKNSMEEAAKALNVNVPPVIDGAVKVINDLNKKGKVKSTKFEVTVNDQSRTVETQEEALRWLNAEALVAVLAEANVAFEKFARSFDGSIDQMEAGLQALMGLATAVGRDPVEDAKKAVEDSQKSGLELYRTQKEEFDKVLETFDGGLTSIQTLTDATNSLKQAQYDLAAGYLQVKEQAADMLQGTAKSIRESMMNPEEIYDSRQTEIQGLTSELMGETDPKKLMDLATQINSLITDSWNLLDTDQREVVDTEFLSLLDQVEAILNERVGVGLDDITADAGELNRQLQEKLTEVAGQQLDAAITFSDAVDRFAETVGGGTGNRSRNASGELNG